MCAWSLHILSCACRVCLCLCHMEKTFIRSNIHFILHLRTQQWCLMLLGYKQTILWSVIPCFIQWASWDSIQTPMTLHMIYDMNDMHIHNTHMRKPTLLLLPHRNPPGKKIQFFCPFSKPNFTVVTRTFSTCFPFSLHHCHSRTDPSSLQLPLSAATWIVHFSSSALILSSLSSLIYGGQPSAK